MSTFPVSIYMDPPPAPYKETSLKKITKNLLFTNELLSYSVKLMQVLLYISPVDLEVVFPHKKKPIFFYKKKW